jgi:Flp pilus assembly protein TadG
MSMIRGLLRRLGRARRGNIGMIAGLAAVPMVGVVGFAVDGARAWLVHSRLRTAVDAGALAGARNINVATSTRDAQITDMVRTNFMVQPNAGGAWVNFLNTTPAPVRPTITPVDSNTLQISATVQLPTLFLPVLGLTTLTISASATAQRANLGMEVALVLDVTGSMDTNCSTPSDRTATNCTVTTVPSAPGQTINGVNSNIDLLRLAAADMVNILYGTNDTLPNLWVGVVPFTTTINLGPSRTGWLDPTAAANLGSNFAPTTWRGCVEARSGGGDQTDDPPTVSRFMPFYYPSTLGVYPNYQGRAVPGDNDWARTLWTSTTTTANAITEDYYSFRGNNQVGPNVGCPATVVLPLTPSKTTVLASIQSLRSSFRGGTMGNLGLQGGWFVLSPRWRGLWGGTTPNTLPQNYNTPLMQKVIVMMTDGTNQWYDFPGGAPGDCSDTGVNTASNPTSVTPRVSLHPVACPSGYPNNNDADYTGYGRLLQNRLGLGTVNNANAQTEINNRVATICTAVKNAGIIIYTVILDTSGASTSAATRALYQGCATSPDYYYFVSTPTGLRPAFQQIGNQLANLRVTR